MIKVIIKEEKKRIVEVQILGHALYNDFGKDIVCSAVSSIITTTVNGIMMIDNDALKYEEKPSFKIDILKDDEITDKLILNMINLLKELEKDYPKNIKFL